MLNSPDVSFEGAMERRIFYCSELVLWIQRRKMLKLHWLIKSDEGNVAPNTLSCNGLSEWISSSVKGERKVNFLSFFSLWNTMILPIYQGKWAFWKQLLDPGMAKIWHRVCVFFAAHKPLVLLLTVPFPF